MTDDWFAMRIAIAQALSDSFFWVVRPDETDVVILLMVVLAPHVHDHALGAVRRARAAPVSDVVLSAAIQPSPVGVVAIMALMLIPMTQVIAERHAASFSFPWCLILALPYLISKAWWALIFVRIFLFILFFLLVIFLALFLLLVFRLLLLLVITSFLLFGLFGLSMASSLLFWCCHWELRFMASFILMLLLLIIVMLILLLVGMVLLLLTMFLIMLLMLVLFLTLIMLFLLIFLFVMMVWLQSLLLLSLFNI